MDDRAEIENLYRRMYESMISKEREVLLSCLADDFELVHITGVRQDRYGFADAVMDGTLNYYSAEVVSLDIRVEGGRASLVGRSVVSAAVYGGGKHSWRLQSQMSARRTSGGWKITGSSVSPY